MARQKKLERYLVEKPLKDIMFIKTSGTKVNDK